MNKTVSSVVDSFRSALVGAAAFSLLACALVLTACSDEQPIRVYEAPKDTLAPPPDPHAGLDMSAMGGTGTGSPPAVPGMREVFGDPQRILAVTVPTPSGVWFFKLTGPKEKVETLVGEIDAFLQTVEFIDEAPGVQFAAPGTWSTLAPGMYATAKWELAEDTIFSVTRLDITPFGDRELFDNVNRWRTQVGMQPATFTEIQSDSRSVPVGGLQGTWVDLAPDTTSQESSTPSSPGAVTATGGAGAMTWTLPAGWSEVPSSSSVRIATFRVEGSEAEIVITKFPGDVGGTLANVNRWRGQAGLTPVSPGDLESSMESMTVAGRDAYLVDAAGDSSRVLAAGISTTAETWFVKAQGAPGEVGKIVDGFREFLGMIRFGDN